MRFLLALILSLLPGLSAAQTIDYNIANQSFPTFRADLNNHLEAIVEQNAGTVAPGTTFPYMVWADTSGATPVLRYRNAANSGWASAFRIEPTQTVWLGAVESSAANITGGSLNGVTIGSSVPSTGIFSALIANAAIRSNSAAPGIFLRETDATTTHNGTWVVADGNSFTIQTRNSGDGFVSTDYLMTRTAAGAATHQFYTGNAVRLSFGASTFTYTIGDGGAGSGIGFQYLYNGLRNELRPTASGAADLGSSTRRWYQAFFWVAPDVISDARLKNSIEDVAEAECRAADRIEIRRYRLNADADGAWRFGAIAQEVIAAFAAEGLDWQDYAIVTGSESGGYGIAYDELQNLKLACMGG